MPLSYQQLQHHLQSPRRIIIDPLQRECDPPEDPDWPAPMTPNEVEQLMHRLPHWAQIVCALTAAEMVLPNWEEDEWVRRNLSKEYREAPSQAIETTWQWLDGDASEAKLNAAATTAWEAAVATAARAGAWATRAGAWAAEVAARAARAARTARTARTARAIRATRDVWTAWAAAWAASGDVEEFYREWWDLCRCRLAFILESRPFLS